MIGHIPKNSMLLLVVYMIKLVLSGKNYLFYYFLLYCFF